jgi:hypothetical protein
MRSATSDLCHFRTKCTAAKKNSFDHIVGAHEQRLRNIDAKRLGGPRIDHQVVFGRRLHRVLRNIESSNPLHCAQHPACGRRSFLLCYIGVSDHEPTVARDF